MKRIKLLMIALIAVLGFSSCEKHECNNYDHSADLVGTWTCLKADYAEALVISADGSVVSTGVAFGEYWENVKGNIVLKDGKVTMTFEDHDNYEGHFDIIPGMAFSVFNDEVGRFTYNYCKEDLSDEIVGMWVNNVSPSNNGERITVQTYKENGKAIFTGFGSYADNFLVNDETTYKVIGDLLIYSLPKDKIAADASPYITMRLSYSPDGTTYGDIMGMQSKGKNNGQEVEITSSMLRIRQSLDLTGKKYDYIKTFVSNVKGEDKDIPFFGSTINFANLDNSVLDKFLKATLFAVQFPNANIIEYSFLAQQLTTLQAPISVEGNKMTVKMSANHTAYRDVEIYSFQDVDCSQFHMYMPTSTFKNFIGNMQVNQMWKAGLINLDDADAVKAVFDTIDGAIETINVSLVMESSTKAR